MKTPTHIHPTKLSIWARIVRAWRAQRTPKGPKL